MKKNTDLRFASRRSLLKFLASSPLLGATTLQSLSGNLFAADNPALLEADMDSLIQSPDEAINLFDFHRVISQTMPTYLSLWLLNDRCG